MKSLSSFVLIAVVALVFSVKAYAYMTETYLGNYEISCAKMVVARLQNQNQFWGPAKVLPKNTEACDLILKPRPINAMLQPITAVFRRMAPDDGPADISPTKEDVLALRDKILRFRADFLPVVEACRAMSGRNADPSVICYVGAPSSESSAPLRALFSALLKGPLPNAGAICSSDPLEMSTAATEEFAAMISEKQQKTSWPEIREALEADGFSCRGDNCFRGIMAIAPNPKLDESDIKLEPDFFLIPRLLNMYRGEWKQVGRPITLCKGDDQSCVDSRPEIGASGGICIAEEDGHTWGYTGVIFNAPDEFVR